jgi:phosphoheptose isomerase
MANDAATDNATFVGLTGDSGGALAAVCAHASAKIEQEAASRIVELGTEIISCEQGEGR